MERQIPIDEEEMWTPFLEEANKLFLEEKAARHEGDHIKQAEVSCRIVQYAFDNNEFARLRQFLSILVKRRNQSKKAIVDLSQCCITFLERMPSKEEKLLLLESIQEATKGKFFVEVEYARCIRMYCEMKESDGDVEEACRILQEVPVETYGSMDRQEKFEFILYQMRMVLARKDFVRCQIISKKVSKKLMEEKGFERQKIEYLLLLTRYYVHERMPMQAAQAYQGVFDTLSGPAEAGLDQGGRGTALANFALYLMISPYSNEQVNLLNIVSEKYSRELQGQETVLRFVQKFLAHELMPLNEADVRAAIQDFEPFRAETENHSQHYKEFIRQIIQHNLRVIEKFYARIRLHRLSELIGVSVERAEHEIADMVVNGRIVAKINRMEGIVNFQKKKFVNDVLNDWRGDINELLGKIEETCHLINRERVVHSK